MAHILVIEDDHINLELITFLLKSFGHTIATAMDGAVGVEVAQKEHFDLIICDIKLPRLDGFGVIKLLKGDELVRRVPVIAVSSYAIVGDKERAMDSGFDGYIAKPIDPAAFVKDIEACLHGRS